MWVAWRRFKYRFKRKRCPWYFRYIKYKCEYAIRIVLFGIFVLLSVWGTTHICHRVQSVVDELAVSKANSAVNTMVNNTILNLLSDDKTAYEKIINQSKNADNNITSMNLNYIEVNRFKSNLALKIQDNLNTLDSAQVFVPFGTFVSNNLLTGFGFKIPIKVIVSGTVEVAFNEEFNSAGINQTDHMIEAVVKAPVAVIYPMRKMKTDVEVRIPIAETIIVGTVPDTYLSFGK